MGERFPKGARVRSAATGQTGVVEPGPPSESWRFVRLDGSRGTIMLCHVDGLEEVREDGPAGEAAPVPDAPLPPWACAVASGAALWQQADPMRRSCHVEMRGHVVGVTAALGPGRDGYTARFLGPVREEAVGAALDLVVRDESHTPHLFGINRLFPEEVRP